mmetsp:Transcript_24015/g.23776  ORF Transcript_24015/g.23776 Transcript_24015/m.23776 type:complete len:91 (+) Transcript_24015:246-518(+)|eukprot:CAMPEP_0202943202 /NCGR_PEP_ID=MMETSP1395-20130829/3568_1 /ASSEMBLY_ACC=CAM_ASM_000871 /TAXON_ID=5961 /ORGANISM="Blepharisma japonicum, Strain Stock R1072" /LENGTH=90 /DNA_ID=CAMNT_0049640371 /DNA_START=908 /DNA_END=1180 /DNA_ORIENTATION=+
MLTLLGKKHEMKSQALNGQGKKGVVQNEDHEKSTEKKPQTPRNARNGAKTAKNDLKSEKKTQPTNIAEKSRESMAKLISKSEKKHIKMGK